MEEPSSLRFPPLGTPQKYPAWSLPPQVVPGFFGRRSTVCHLGVLHTPKACCPVSVPPIPGIIWILDLWILDPRCAFAEGSVRAGPPAVGVRQAPDQEGARGIFLPKDRLGLEIADPIALKEATRQRDPFFFFLLWLPQDTEDRAFFSNHPISLARATRQTTEGEKERQEKERGGKQMRATWKYVRGQSRFVPTTHRFFGGWKTVDGQKKKARFGAKVAPFGLPSHWTD